MATLSSQTSRIEPVLYRRHRVGIVRLGAAGAITSAVFFVLCWIGTFIPLASPTHAFIGLFTPAKMGSIEALIEGGLWSSVFGGFSGALLAVIYNLLSGLDRR